MFKHLLTAGMQTRNMSLQNRHVWQACPCVLAHVHSMVTWSFHMTWTCAPNMAMIRVSSHSCILIILSHRHHLRHLHPRTLVNSPRSLAFSSFCHPLEFSPSRILVLSSSSRPLGFWDSRPLAFSPPAFSYSCRSVTWSFHRIVVLSHCRSSVISSMSRRTLEAAC